MGLDEQLQRRRTALQRPLLWIPRPSNIPSPRVLRRIYAPARPVQLSEPATEQPIVSGTGSSSRETKTKNPARSPAESSVGNSRLRPDRRRWTHPRQSLPTNRPRRCREDNLLLRIRLQRHHTVKRKWRLCRSRGNPATTTSEHAEQFRLGLRLSRGNRQSSHTRCDI